VPRKIEVPNLDQDIAGLGLQVVRAGGVSQKVVYPIITRVNAELQQQIGAGDAYVSQQAQAGDQSLYAQIQAVGQRVNDLETGRVSVFPSANPMALIPTHWGPPPGWYWMPSNGTVKTSTGLTLYLAARY
jgi:hypothetical protein